MREENSEYPTREELQEFLEAHRKGGDAILELLRKKWATRSGGAKESVKETPEPTHGSADS